MGKGLLGMETSAEKAAKSAAGAQVDASQAAIDEQRRQFDITQANYQPYQAAGSAALTQQQALLGLSGQDAQQQAYNQFTTSPGQQFLQERAQKNLLRNAAAIGGLGGGNVRNALVEQGVGFAQQDFQNQFGRLGQLAGQGQAAVSSLGGIGANTAGNIGNLQQASGQARASGILGAQQAQSDMFTQGLGAVGQAAGFFL